MMKQILGDIQKRQNVFRPSSDKKLWRAISPTFEWTRLIEEDYNLNNRKTCIYLFLSRKHIPYMCVCIGVCGFLCLFVCKSKWISFVYNVLQDKTDYCSPQRLFLCRPFLLSFIFFHTFCSDIHLHILLL